LIREQRLKNIRATADTLPLRPRTDTTRASLIKDLPAKTKPRQAAPVNGTVKRQPASDPIPAETIPRAFDGKTAVLMATGPGLTPEVVAEVMDARLRQELYLFGCNDAYRIAPYLNVHYACDFAWWRKHFENMVHYETTHGMWTQEPNMSQHSFPGLHRIKGCGAKGLSRKQDLIHFGNNSGFQLINLAYLFGITKFILCGYNMQVIGGKKHFFGEHPEGLNRGGGYTGFIQNYDTIKPADYGIEIINATPQTALRAFPKMSLTDALQRFR
jgi:hypothetical protein